MSGKRGRMFMELVRGRIAYIFLGLGLFFVFTSNSFALDANHFDIAPGEKYTVVVPTTGTIGHGEWGVDFFYSFADRPLEGAPCGTDLDLVKQQHLVQLALTFGISERQQLSVSMPYVVDQDSEFIRTGKEGFGDLTLVYKHRFPEENYSSVSFAVAPYIQFDTGDEGIYMNAGSTAFGIRGIFDNRISRDVLWTANLGYAYQDQESLGDVDIKHSLLFGTGLVYMIPDTGSYMAAEIHGRSEDAFSFSGESTPVEALLSYGYARERFTFTIGGGAGLTNGYGASDWRVFIGTRFAI